MVTTRLRSILVLFLLLLAAPAFSQVDCGTNPKDVPADVQRQLSGDVEGKAQLFTKLLGDANLKGTVQTSKNEIYQKYNNIDKIRLTDTWNGSRVKQL